MFFPFHYMRYDTQTPETQRMITTVFCPMAKGLAATAAGAQRPDLLVVNPPRRGIGEQLATRIEASGVERVLYSSCNPRTLATDLAHLPSMRVVRSRLFDMFPHTDHAEVLVELVRD